jgi:phosphinothricin acetyltransferase
MPPATVLCQTEPVPDLKPDPMIRRACADDAGAIAAIYAHYVQHSTATFDTVGRTTDEIAEKIADCAGRNWPFLQAQQGPILVGYADAAQLRNRAAYQATCENSIYIHPGHVRQGVGKAVLAALLVAAEQAGFRQMIAVIGGAGQASIALHAGGGFVHAVRMRSVGRKFGQWLDTVYMQIGLGTGGSMPPPKEPA